LLWLLSPIITQASVSKNYFFSYCKLLSTKAEYLFALFLGQKVLGFCIWICH